MFEHATSHEAVVAQRGNRLREVDDLQRRGVTERILRNLRNGSEILQLFEAADIRATECLTQVGHGLCLVEREFAVEVGIPILQTDGLCRLVGEGDEMHLLAHALDCHAQVIVGALSAVEHLLFVSHVNLLLLGQGEHLAELLHQIVGLAGCLHVLLGDKRPQDVLSA